MCYQWTGSSWNQERTVYLFSANSWTELTQRKWIWKWYLQNVSHLCVGLHMFSDHAKSSVGLNLLVGKSQAQMVSLFNSLWPDDAIWLHGTRPTLVQVMACCLTAPSHYLNQCWLIIGEMPWHSSEGIIVRRCEDTIQWNKIENCSFKMASSSPRGQWNWFDSIFVCQVISEHFINTHPQGLRGMYNKVLEFIPKECRQLREALAPSSKE